MRYHHLIIIIVLVFSSCLNDKNIAVEEDLQNFIYFPKGETIHFDTIKVQGNKRELTTFEFPIENHGMDTLIITNVRGSGGSCAPDYDRTPLAPKKGTTIKYSCDLRQMIGKRSKCLAMETNFGYYRLCIRGYIQKMGPKHNSLVY